MHRCWWFSWSLSSRRWGLGLCQDFENNITSYFFPQSLTKTFFWIIYYKKLFNLKSLNMSMSYLHNDNRSTYTVWTIFPNAALRSYLVWWHLWVLNHYALHLPSHACPLGIEQTRVLGLLHSHHALVAWLLAGNHGLETLQITIGAEKL